MAATSKTFHYTYEDILDESVEASLAPLGEYFSKASRWRPSVPLLAFGGISGGVLAVLANTVSGKVLSLLVPILLTLLLTISSKQTRIEGARRQVELLLRKNYSEKKCHLHDISIEEKGVVETCPCGTDTRSWQAFRRLHETERMIVIEALNKSLYVIPKRVVPPEELQPLRDFLSQQIQQANL
jgi:hypothetical protein